MNKAVLNKFLIDRVHKDWIDRLFPGGWKDEDKINCKRRGGGEHGGFSE